MTDSYYYILCLEKRVPGGVTTAQENIRTALSIRNNLVYVRYCIFIFVVVEDAIYLEKIE